MSTTIELPDSYVEHVQQAIDQTEENMELPFSISVSRSKLLGEVIQRHFDEEELAKEVAGEFKQAVEQAGA